MEANPTIVFPEKGKVVIEDREVPSPGAGQLLIRTRCTLISTGTEMTILAGGHAPDSAWGRLERFPFLPGYDNIGEVVATGEAVEAEWIGRRVATYANHARYVLWDASDARVVHRPSLADAPATFFTIAEICMNGLRRGGVRWGEAVVVYGLGLLGQVTVRLCRLCGARPVIAVDVAQSRLGPLPAGAAVSGVNAAREDVVAAIDGLTRGRMADVAFEVTGSPDLIPGELRGLREQGRFVLLSSPRGSTQFDFHDLCNAPSFTIIGAHNGSHPPVGTPDNPWTTHRHAELFFDLVADGELDLDPLISHFEPHVEAPRLYEMLAADRTQAMGVVLDWSMG